MRASEQRPEKRAGEYEPFVGIELLMASRQSSGTRSFGLK